MKIKSILNVITNSSSEVFIIKNLPQLSKESAGCLSYHNIDFDWVKNEILWKREAFEILLDIEIPDFYEEIMDWDQKSQIISDWCEEHKDLIEEKCKGYMWVDLEDHYDYDAYYSDANILREESIYYDYRH